MATSEEGAAPAGPAGAELTIPQMGVVEQVLVVEWLVEDGSLVTAGESVVVIDTDKAETELEAPASGRLHVLVPAGDEEVAVGTVLATVSTG
ncbi:MAG: dihydrolipoamide acyltransferase [Acidimicrobiaceae bacterium]|nr:dihydrolipoamide acyltransferase [Acidimicrobiaceae bacterium]MYH78045.1 dihydrolipoamide acyltransferase [Acidimicrobiaceae bacterium]MYK77691.1 dihydrolipoamide acyltransferase [Acidimicrobiaceae bacterium]